MEGPEGTGDGMGKGDSSTVLPRSQALVREGVCNCRQVCLRLGGTAFRSTDLPYGSGREEGQEPRGVDGRHEKNCAGFSTS